MITIRLSTDDITKVRLAPSPLWETVGSFGVLLHQWRETVHGPWAARTRRVLPGTDLPALVAAMCVAGRCPDFLTPPPDASSPDPNGTALGAALGDSRASAWTQEPWSPVRNRRWRVGPPPRRPTPVRWLLEAFRHQATPVR